MNRDSLAELAGLTDTGLPFLDCANYTRIYEVKFTSIEIDPVPARFVR